MATFLDTVEQTLYYYDTDYGLLSMRAYIIEVNLYGSRTLPGVYHRSLGKVASSEEAKTKAQEYVNEQKDKAAKKAEAVQKLGEALGL